MMKDVATFQQYLKTHCAHYFPDFPAESLTITAVSHQVRPQSTLFFYTVHGRGWEQAILVKVPSSRQNQEATAGIFQPKLSRPRLYPDVSGEEKWQMENTALVAIEAYFAALHDPRFGHIRVLSLIPESQAIVMTVASDPHMRELVRPGWTWGRDLTSGFLNAGAWLAAFHQMLPPRHAQPRQLNRSAYVDTIRRFTQFLGEKNGNPRFFASVAQEVISKVDALLPADIPIGLMHGDFALRNILLGEDNTVTVFDTLARWCAPIYEDIAYFLLSLHSNRWQVVSQGFAFRGARLSAYEKAFLDGYFADAIPPLSLISLFEIQALLNKWSSQFSLIQTGRRGPFKELQLGITNRYYRRYMRRLLTSLEEAV